jgi:hypothetical protein
MHTMSTWFWHKTWYDNAEGLQPRSAVAHPSPVVAVP